MISRSELDEAHTYTGAFLAVSMESGFTVGFGTGPWVTPSARMRGNHGYWPGPPDLDAAFVAFGGRDSGEAVATREACGRGAHSGEDSRNHLEWRRGRKSPPLSASTQLGVKAQQVRQLRVIIS